MTTSPVPSEKQSERWVCWFRHNWTDWVDTHEVEKFTVTNDLINCGIEQKRTCLRCGKIKTPS